MIGKILDRYIVRLENFGWIWTDWKIRLIRYGKNFGNFEMLDKASQV